MNKIMESKSLPKQNLTQDFGQNAKQDFAHNKNSTLDSCLDFATPLLEVKNVCFWRFAGLQKLHILKNISFSLQAGEILSILGCNGAGKTTLIKCLLGFLKSEGQIFLQGQDIARLGRSMWEQIAYVAQNKGAVLPISALEMVVLGLNSAIRFKPSKEHFMQASATLAELGIAHLSEKNCATLSGGELQMVLFARALVKRPKILILDEPESNLDFANQKMILDTLKNLAKQGCAIVINTHFPAHALFLSHKVLLLSKASKDSSADCNGIFGESAKLLNEEHLSSLYSVPLELHSKVSPFKQSEFIVRI